MLYSICDELPSPGHTKRAMKPEHFSLSHLQRELARISPHLATPVFHAGSQAIWVNLEDGVSLLGTVTWSAETGEIRGEIGERTGESDRRTLLTFDYTPSVRREGEEQGGVLQATDFISEVAPDSATEILRNFAMRLEGMTPRIERPGHDRPRQSEALVQA